MVKSKRGIAHIGGSGSYPWRRGSCRTPLVLDQVDKSFRRRGPVGSNRFGTVPIDSQKNSIHSLTSVPKASRLETHQSLGKLQPQRRSTPSNDDRRGFPHV